MHRYLLFLFAGLSFLLTSCEKEDPAPDSTIQIEQGKGVFVLHEGAFNQGNASLGYVRDGESMMHTRLFAEVNDRPLGDVLQSMSIDGQTGYLVLNNSRTIEQIDLRTIALQQQLRVHHAPRYLLPTGAGEALISTIFSPWLLIADLDPLVVVDSIDLGHWSEEMIPYQDDVLVAASDHDRVYRMDPNTRSVVDSLPVGFGAYHLAIDGQERLWVLCTGNFVDIPASIHVVDLATGATDRSWVFSQSEFPGKLQVIDNMVYYLNGGLYRMPVDAVSLPTAPWIAGFSYYGYRIDPRDGRIWMANPIDFQQKGTIDIFDETGTLVESLAADQVPSDFRFF